MDDLCCIDRVKARDLWTGKNAAIRFEYDSRVVHGENPKKRAHQAADGSWRSFKPDLSRKKRKDFGESCFRESLDSSSRVSFLVHDALFAYGVLMQAIFTVRLTVHAACWLHDGGLGIS